MADDGLREAGGVVIGSDCPCVLRPPFKVTQSVTGYMPTRSMGRIGVLEITLIAPTLQRGNAAQDAPRPLWNATHISVTTRPLGAWT